jgi:hypothetical protein
MEARSELGQDYSQCFFLNRISKHPTELEKYLITTRVGFPQHVATTQSKPIESIWVMDISGSMGAIDDPSSKLSHLKQSIVQHVASLDACDCVTIVTFDVKGMLVIKRCSKDVFLDEKSVERQAFNTINSDEGCTWLQAGIDAIPTPDNNDYERVIHFGTDGRDYQGENRKTKITTLDGVMKALKQKYGENQVPRVFTIGFGEDYIQEMLRDLTLETKSGLPSNLHITREQEIPDKIAFLDIFLKANYLTDATLKVVINGEETLHSLGKIRFNADYERVTVFETKHYEGDLWITTSLNASNLQSNSPIVQEDNVDLLCDIQVDFEAHERLADQLLRQILKDPLLAYLSKLQADIFTIQYEAQQGFENKTDKIKVIKKNIQHLDNYIFELAKIRDLLNFDPNDQHVEVLNRISEALSCIAFYNIEFRKVLGDITKKTSEYQSTISNNTKSITEMCVGLSIQDKKQLKRDKQGDRTIAMYNKFEKLGKHVISYDPNDHRALVSLGEQWRYSINKKYKVIDSGLDFVPFFRDYFLNPEKMYPHRVYYPHLRLISFDGSVDGREAILLDLSDPDDDHTNIMFAFLKSVVKNLEIHSDKKNDDHAKKSRLGKGRRKRNARHREQSSMKNVETVEPVENVLARLACYLSEYVQTPHDQKSNIKQEAAANYKPDFISLDNGRMISCVHLSNFIESGVGSCCHQAPLMALALVYVALHGKSHQINLPIGRVTVNRATDYHHNAHAFTLYETEKDLYLIDCTLPGEKKVFNLTQTQELVMLIKIYNERNQYGLLHHLLEEKNLLPLLNGFEHLLDLPSLSQGLLERAEHELETQFYPQPLLNAEDDQNRTLEIALSKLRCPISHQFPVCPVRPQLQDAEGRIFESEYVYELDELQHYYDEHESLYPITECKPILPFEMSQKDVNLMYNLCNKLIYGNYLKPEKYLGASLKEESINRKQMRDVAWRAVWQHQLQTNENACPKELGQPSTYSVSKSGLFAQANVSISTDDSSLIVKSARMM